MRKLSIILFFALLVAHSNSQGKVKALVGLSAIPYPGHVEIQWKNMEGFTYDVYELRSGQFHYLLSTPKAPCNVFFSIDSLVSKRMYAVFPAGVLPDKLNKYSVYYKNKFVLPSEKQFGDAMQTFFVEVNIPLDSEEVLLDMIQKYTTRYFYEFAEPKTGMARERSNEKANIVTTGGTGFGIMALIAAAERNYITRYNAFEMIDRIVGFLEKAERFHGAYAHWYDADKASVKAFSRYDDGGDLVETAFLMQGLLTARKYFEKGNEPEYMLSSRIKAIWEAVDWNWYTQGTDSLYWHWSKNVGFKMNHRIKGFDETLITYVLAASSPSHPISKKVYEASYKTSSYYWNGNSYFGYKLDTGMEYGGPLFFTHYSFLGLNPTGLNDNKVDYFKRNKNHSLIHWEYAKANPKNHTGYGENCWGFTSSDDPLVFYSSHHPGTDQDNGTISPTAALSSIVYTPEQSMKALRHFYYIWGPELLGEYGFYDSFNPGLIRGQQINKSYLAIDQGPIAVMIENYRSGLLWDLFLQNTEVVQGLSKLGFWYKK